MIPEYLVSLPVLVCKHALRMTVPRGNLVDDEYVVDEGIPESKIPEAEWFMTMDTDVRDAMYADLDVGARVEQISSSFDISGLESSPLFPELGPALTLDEILPRVKEKYKVNNVDVFEWMQEETAWKALITARVAEFNKHSEVRVRSGDGYIPGVIMCRNMRFLRERGHVVRSRGHANAIVLTRVRVPVHQGITVYGRRRIAFAGVTWTGWIQYGAVLGHYVRFPTRVTRRIGFMHIGRSIMPLFVAFSPRRGTKRARVTIVVSSSHDADFTITWRRADDYTSIIDSAKLSLPSGRSRITFTVADVRGLPPVLMQFEINVPGTLDRYEYSTG